jgi:hypothetical protein
MDEGIPAIISFLLFFLAPYVAVSIVPSWIWLFIVSIGGAVLYDSFDSLDSLEKPLNSENNSGECR